MMSDTDEAILSMPALMALGLCITLAGLEVVKHSLQQDSLLIARTVAG